MIDALCLLSLAGPIAVSVCNASRGSTRDFVVACADLASEAVLKPIYAQQMAGKSASTWAPCDLATGGGAEVVCGPSSPSGQGEGSYPAVLQLYEDDCRHVWAFMPLLVESYRFRESQKQRGRAQAKK